MELKEKLAEILKEKYGIESKDDLKKEVESMPGIDFGIFLADVGEESKSA